MLSGSLRETANRLGVYGGRVVPVVADLADVDARGAIVPSRSKGSADRWTSWSTTPPPPSINPWPIFPSGAVV